MGGWVMGGSVDEQCEVGAGQSVTLLERVGRVADVARAVDTADDERAAIARDAREPYNDVRLRVRHVRAAVRETGDRQTGRRVDGRRVVRALGVVPLRITPSSHRHHHHHHHCQWAA